MNQTHLREAIADCAYKEGWSFGFEPGDFPMLLLTANVPNSRGPGRIEFTVKRLIPSYVLWGSELVITHWVKAMIIEAEVHEVREFFRYKGELVDDPHTFRLVSDDEPLFVTPGGSTRPSEWPR
jgi:hypothetical protein